jgi:hypothetical protein
MLAIIPQKEGLPTTIHNHPDPTTWKDQDDTSMRKDMSGFLCVSSVGTPGSADLVSRSRFSNTHPKRFQNYAKARFLGREDCGVSDGTHHHNLLLLRVLSTNPSSITLYACDLLLLSRYSCVLTFPGLCGECAHAVLSSPPHQTMSAAAPAAKAAAPAASSSSSASSSGPARSTDYFSGARMRSFHFLTHTRCTPCF